jgi:hypothetical protein
MGAMLFKDAAEFSGEKILLLASFDQPGQEQHRNSDWRAPFSNQQCHSDPIGRSKNHAGRDQVANASVLRPTDEFVGTAADQFWPET